MIEWSPGTGLSTWEQMNSAMSSPDAGFAAQGQFYGGLNNAITGLSAIGKEQGLTGSDRAIADSLVSLNNNSGARANVIDPSKIFSGYSTGDNINWSGPGMDRGGSFFSNISPYLTVLAPFAAGLAAPGMFGAGGTGGAAGETSAGMMAGQEAGFGTADLAGWGGATTTGETAAGGLGNLWGKATNYAKANPFGAIKNTYGGLSTIGSLMGGNSGNQSGGTGGNMGKIGDWASALSPFLSALNTNNQAGNTSDTYGKAYDLITTPSPDQQNYRTQLAQLMANPGSMESSPVYKAMAEAGMNNVNRTAAAKGMLGSGNRLAELMKVGQDTASRYYFPQQQALAQLSGVTGDSATRALGADSLLGAQSAENKQQTKMLSDLMSGFGVKTPEQQLLDAYMKRLGGNGGGSTSGVDTIVNGVKNGYDWLTGGDNSTLTQSGSTLDSAQLQALLNQQGGFNWSGMDGVIGGSQQDQMLYDQMPADWFN